MLKRVMPGKGVHVSAIIGPVLIAEFLLGFNIIENYLGYILVAIVGILAPDILEPPTNYQHRNIFHSRRILKFFMILSFVFILFGLALDEIFFYLTTFIVGYNIHLFLDSQTPMGLPH